MSQNNYNGILQKPVGSGFNAKSTASEVIRGIDLSGKIAIVTGGSGGLGLEVTRTLASAGATVIAPARDVSKAQGMVADIPNVEIASLDLSQPDSITGFADKFLQSGRPLHILVNNAGIMWTPFTKDQRGYESQFSTNHLGHFQLTAQLWTALKKANGARVINVSSSGHYFSPIVFEDINYDKRPYNKFEAYGQSKTANILFSLELDKRAQNSGVRAYSLHPGLILETNLGRYLTFDDYVALGAVNAEGKPNKEYEAAIEKVKKNAQQGAATTIWAATNRQLSDIGGVYCEDVEVAVFNPNIRDSSMFDKKGPAAFALDPEAATRLWDVSEQMTGVKFEF